MHKVLVTGGAGFIGSNFVRHLLEVHSEVRVVNLDALTYAGSLENLRDLPHSERYTFVQGDICDRAHNEKLLDEHEIDTIVHFAAESHVDRSIDGPGAFMETNIRGTFELLEAARSRWLQEAGAARGKRFHHVSTDEVYGSLEPAEPAFHEERAYSPNSPYSASKAASDHIVRAYGHTYGLPFTMSNCSNNYGPYQFPEKLVPLTIVNALAGRRLPVYGDGQQVRDWLYVVDHCQAIIDIIESGKNGETYNVGGNNQPTNLEIIKSICAILDEIRPQEGRREELIEFVKDRPGHDRRYAMNIDKIAADLDWQPSYSLERGLRATVQWYLQSESWLAAVSKRSDYQTWITRNYKNR